MGIICKVKNCNSEQHKGSKISFHRFPVNDPDLLKSWLDIIGLSDWSPKRQDSICSLHFTDDQFVNTKPRRLVKNAIPTIFSRDTKTNGSDLSSNGMNTELSISSCTDNSDTEDSHNENTYRSNQLKENGKIKFHNPRFPGDFNEEDLKSPERMKRMWDIANKQILEQRKKLKTLQQKNRRLECQVIRLKNLVKHLKTVHH